MRLAAYQFTTSGGSALSALRIWVFHASRSTMVRSTVRFGMQRVEIGGHLFHHGARAGVGHVRDDAERRR
jgi:hypothetical protein